MYVDVDALGAKLTYNISLMRESASSAFLEDRLVDPKRGCDCSIYVSSGEKDDNGGLDVPPPARGAGMVVLPGWEKR
jgi:hypothetical protein